MRIRKRQVPLPFSSLSPIPLSDPTPPVQLHRHDTTAHVPDGFLLQEEKEVEELDDTRERSVFGAEIASNGIVSQSTSSPQAVGRWCEREKTFPLKKRRGSFEKPIDDEDNQTTPTTIVKSPDQKKTLKTKMNKKCTLPQKQEDQSKLGLDLTGKKKSRGGALMEGSRCSRVNGRGWRCCQQTLVGYSLCEHHLGKGRLRSMNSVRSRSLAAPKTVIVVDGEDEKKPSPSPPTPTPPPSLMFTSKKRMKLGVVKARSMSSLLGQTDSMMAAAARPSPPPPPPPPPSLDVNVDDE